MSRIQSALLVAALSAQPLAASVSNVSFGSPIDPAPPLAFSSDSTCDPTDPPGSSSTFALPRRYHLELSRTADTLSVELVCSAVVRDSAGVTVWQGAGFRTRLHGWTGRDVDGDGEGDVVLGIDTGGGERCCWTYALLKLSPAVQEIGVVSFLPYFEPDPRGGTLIAQSISVSLDTLETVASVLRIHQVRGGRLGDVTQERCGLTLGDSPLRQRVIPWERDHATAVRRKASREATAISEEVDATREAVISMAVQEVMCGQAAEARRLLEDTWPQPEAAVWLRRVEEAGARELRLPTQN
jgi:hypothetical protein